MATNPGGGPPGRTADRWVGRRCLDWLLQPPRGAHRRQPRAPSSRRMSRLATAATTKTAGSTTRAKEELLALLEVASPRSMTCPCKYLLGGCSWLMTQPSDHRLGAIGFGEQHL